MGSPAPTDGTSPKSRAAVTSESMINSPDATASTRSMISAAHTDAEAMAMATPMQNAKCRMRNLPLLCILHSAICIRMALRTPVQS